MNSLEVDMLSNTLNSLTFKSPISIQSEKKHQLALAKKWFESNNYIHLKKINKLCDTKLDDEVKMVIQDTQSNWLTIL